MQDKFCLSRAVCLVHPCEVYQFNSFDSHAMQQAQVMHQCIEVAWHGTSSAKAATACACLLSKIAPDSSISEYRVLSDTQHRKASFTAQVGVTPTTDHRLMNLLTPLSVACRHDTIASKVFVEVYVGYLKRAWCDTGHV